MKLSPQDKRLVTNHLNHGTVSKLLLLSEMCYMCLDVLDVLGCVEYAWMSWMCLDVLRVLRCVVCTWMCYVC